MHFSRDAKKGTPHADPAGLYFKKRQKVEAEVDRPKS